MLALLSKHFLFQMPGPTFIWGWFVLAGTLYVSGAVGLEMVEAYLDSKWGTRNWYTDLLCGVEEALEMAAVILFIYTLLTYLSRPKHAVTVGVVRKKPN